jgi:uncharacterized protein (DUF1330 family)
MKGYVVVNIFVHDVEMFGRYRDAVAPLIAQFGGRYLIRGGKLEHAEGKLPLKRLVVLEFPTLTDAKRFYNSPEYAPVLKLRLDSATSDLAFVEGDAG